MRFKEFLIENIMSEDDKTIEKTVSLDKKLKYKSNELVLKTIKHLFSVDLSSMVNIEKQKYFSVDFDLEKNHVIYSWVSKNYRVERNGGLGWAIYNTKK